MLGRARRAASRTSPSPTHTQRRDSHSVKEVVDAAVQALSSSNGGAVKDPGERFVAALAEEDVYFAWQVQQFTDADWQQRTDSGLISLGLRTAVTDILANGPPPQESPVELTPSLRNFLLIPGVDGSPPRRMRALSALFYSTLCQPIEERQAMMLGKLLPPSLVFSHLRLSSPAFSHLHLSPLTLASCELLALINGLVSRLALEPRHTAALFCVTVPSAHLIYKYTNISDLRRCLLHR